MAYWQIPATISGGKVVPTAEPHDVDAIAHNYRFNQWQQFRQELTETPGIITIDLNRIVTRTMVHELAEMNSTTVQIPGTEGNSTEQVRIVYQDGTCLMVDLADFEENAPAILHLADKE